MKLARCSSSLTFIRSVTSRTEAQTHVPMVMWFGNNTLAQLGIDRDCLQGKTGQPDLSHDNLFHSVLGLLRVRTAVYDPQLDLFASCRPVLATH